MEDPREAQRLLDKVDAGAWISKFAAVHLQTARRVLSVGCGPGVFFPEMAAAYPKVEFVGVDISADRIGEANRRLRGFSNAQFEVADAQALPFASGRFDLVMGRFVLEYLPEKQRAVREMARVCRPRGKVLLQDLDGQLLWHYPEDDRLQKTTDKIVASLAKTGFDPFVGRKLFSLCLEAGLGEIGVQVEPYHLIAGKIDQYNLLLWQTKLEIARPQITKILGSDAAAQKFNAEYLAYLQRPDTFTYSCLFTVTGTKPAAFAIMPAAAT
jgi:SAM-dependent methyltransferase